ncbi:MAG: hypothetical protein AAGD32_05250 [Planctomycetota bacterium]
MNPITHARRVFAIITLALMAATFATGCAAKARQESSDANLAANRGYLAEYVERDTPHRPQAEGIIARIDAGEVEDVDAEITVYDQSRPLIEDYAQIADDEGQVDALFTPRSVGILEWLNAWGRELDRYR